MPNIDITQEPVFSLPFGDSGEDVYRLSGFNYEWAIGGQPFLSVASDEFPLMRGFAQVRKDQFDNQTTPGEQSLQGWWLRSQNDWSAGAGITFLEPSNSERTMRRFASSSGVDVWTPGQVRLLRSMAVDVSAAGVARCVSVVGGSTNYVYSTTGSKVYRSTGAASTEVTGWTGAPSWLVSTGDGVFGFHSTGVDWSPVSGTTASGLWTGAGSAGKGWWVKQRLIAAYGAALYELGGFTGGALPAALYTHPSAGWSWTSAVDIPGAILVAGYSGNSSTIYKFTVDEADGTLPALTSAVTIADLPVGEYVTGMAAYLGSFVVLGTNKGVRVAQVSSSAYASGVQMQYGPLSYESAASVEFFAARDRFVFAGVKDAVDGKSGVIRLDLSELDDAGRAAWANDVSSGTTGTVDGVCLLGSSDRVVVGLNGKGTYVTAASGLVSSGWFVTGQVRYNTLEEKTFRLMRLRRSGLDGTVTVSSVTQDGSQVTLFVYADGSSDTEFGVRPDAPRESMGFKIELGRSASDSSKGPVVRGWQLKALPAVPRKQVWRIPLLCFDQEQDRFGNRSGHVRSGLTRFQSLRNSLLSGEPVVLQDLVYREQWTVLVEDLQFTQTSPPRNASGFGGVMYVTCREL